jgi:transcriptional regulator with XRE-family HTH domain
MADMFVLYFVMLREIYGYTQRELADALGVTQGCFSKLERGLQKPNGIVMVKAWRLAPELFGMMFEANHGRRLIEPLKGLHAETIRDAVKAVKANVDS